MSKQVECGWARLVERCRRRARRLSAACRGHGWALRLRPAQPAACYAVPAGTAGGAGKHVNACGRRRRACTLGTLMPPGCRPAAPAAARTLSPRTCSCQWMRNWQTMNLLGFMTYSSCLGVTRECKGRQARVMRTGGVSASESRRLQLECVAAAGKRANERASRQAGKRASKQASKCACTARKQARTQARK